MASEPIPFLKGHGTGNDFVVIPDPEGSIPITAAGVRALCDRRRGVGGDGMLRVVRTAALPEARSMADRAGWFMDYRNADGGVAEMCGNGMRVFVRYLLEAGLAAPGMVKVATRAGIMTATATTSGDVCVDMGPSSFPGPDGVEVTVGERSWHAVSVSMGNPHAVVFVDDLDHVGDLSGPPDVRPRSGFPRGVNVEFVVARGEADLAMRVYERGVGETRSCGTGACAAVAATARRRGDRLPAAYRVEVPGGGLAVTQRADGHVELTGPAFIVAEGSIRPSLLADGGHP